MALEFHPYPLPPQDDVHPVARIADQASRMMQLYANYSLQQQQLDQQKEQMRQQRILDLIRLRGEYGQNALNLAGTAGLQMPAGFGTPAAAPAAAPVATPSPAILAGGIAGAPDATGEPIMSAQTALPAPKSITDITPHHVAAIKPKTPADLATLRDTEGTHGAKAYMDDQKFITDQAVAQNTIDQNTPANANEVRAALLPFGESGKQQAEALIAGSQNGMVTRSMLSNAVAAQSSIARLSAPNSKPVLQPNPATGQLEWFYPPAAGQAGVAGGAVPAAGGTPVGSPGSPAPRSIPVTAGYTKAQQKVDEDYAKGYSDYVAQGGYTDAEKQLRSLDSAISQLKQNPNVSGRAMGLLPATGRAMVNPQAGVIEGQVRDVIQRSLRPILGAQFTEKEGEMLVRNTYNPLLPPAENAKRLETLKNQMQAAFDAKKQAAQYFEKNGTLAGFRGKLNWSTSDFAPNGAVISSAPGNGSPAPTINPSPGADQGASRYQQAMMAAQEALRVNPNDEKAKRVLQIAQAKLAEAQQ